MGDTFKLFDEDVGPSGAESLLTQEVPCPQVHVDCLARHLNLV